MKLVADEGRVVAISFVMSWYADFPPEKWIDYSGNTVHVRVDFSAVQEISLSSGKKTI
ncbi:hypothetical protein [Paenibacillus sp. L3-i20]|uniref:hypothetical protein n=1 Tax=Paenibacillus sp. L3-i20 TaxID=2905833 RepID=UPI0020BE08FB|nr:hypothetical protein [Paenibacillus sp. L3-i20]